MVMIEVDILISKHDILITANWITQNTQRLISISYLYLWIMLKRLLTFPLLKTEFTTTTSHSKFPKLIIISTDCCYSTINAQSQ